MSHKRSKEDINLSNRRRAWLTRAQLMKIYNNDSDLVEALIAKKVAEGAYRPHPDLPDEPSAVLYQAHH